MAVELGPCSALSVTELVDVFNAGYEGYVIPFRLDEPAFRFMVEAFDIDLDASRVAYDAGEPVGLANLALRGDEAWVGGVGVAAAARRRGIGELLMQAIHDEARARGVARVWLEVIEANEAAFRLYEKLGYELVRWVEVWSLSAEAPGDAAREVPAAEAHARVRELRTVREPWQRADGTVANYADARGVATDDGAAVYRVGGAVQLVQIAGDGLHELVRAIRAHGAVSMLNVPEDDPVAAVLGDLGASVAVRQREMALSL
jgi:GNAT superfamily N-acetyltransferase